MARHILKLCPECNVTRIKKASNRCQRCRTDANKQTDGTCSVCGRFELLSPISKKCKQCQKHHPNRNANGIKKQDARTEKPVKKLCICGCEIRAKDDYCAVCYSLELTGRLPSPVVEYIASKEKFV